MKNNSNWSRTSKHFGEVRPKTKHTWTFYYTGNKEFLAKNTSCGCTATEWNKEKKCITATLTTDEITALATKQGRFHMDKTVTITIQMRDTPPVVLMLKATIIHSSLEIDELKEATKYHVSTSN